MQISSPYFHSLNGRLRIKITQVKGSTVKASELERCLLKLDRVEHVKANPTTGNVLVLYDYKRISQAKIIDALKTLGYLKESENTQDVPAESAISVHRVLAEELGKKLVENLAQVMVKAAFQSLISALI
ncbi:MAG: HMA2 domain-containing protein [bacterium]